VAERERQINLVSHFNRMQPRALKRKTVQTQNFNGKQTSSQNLCFFESKFLVVVIGFYKKSNQQRIKYFTIVT
jgi:hypothetical protein